MSTFIFKEKNPIKKLINTEDATPARTPSIQLPVAAPAAIDVKAEISMRPSKPIFVVPARSAIRPPSAAKRIGVITRNKTAISDKSNSCCQIVCQTILFHHRFFLRKFLLDVSKNSLCCNK
ncbi:hypothetical protein D3C78_1645250 [compost metagenome]